MKKISSTYCFMAYSTPIDKSPCREHSRSAITSSETIMYHASGRYAQKSSIIKSVIHKKKW